MGYENFMDAVYAMQNALFVFVNKPVIELSTVGSVTITGLTDSKLEKLNELLCNIADDTIKITSEHTKEEVLDTIRIIIAMKKLGAAEEERANS